MEMSRQRLRESNVKWSIKLTNESLALKILKLIEIKSLESNAKIIDANINEKISNFIENHFNEDLNYFQTKNKLKINLNTKKDLSLFEYSIVFKSKSKKVLEKVEKFENLLKIVSDKKDKKINIKKEKKPIFKKKNYKNKKKKFVKKT